MKYKNVKTGFVFATTCEIKGEGWVRLDPSPVIKEKEEKPKTTKRVKKC